MWEHVYTKYVKIRRSIAGVHYLERPASEHRRPLAGIFRVRVVPGNCCRDVLHDGIRTCSGILGVSFGMQTIIRGMRGANFNALRAILEPLGVPLGRSGRGSGGSWGALGGVRGRLGPFLAALEPIFAVLARPWASLGRSWVALGRSWAALGCFWAALGPLLGRSWPLLGHSWAALGRSLGRSWDDLGVSWRKLAVLGRSWAVLGPSWRRSWAPKIWISGVGAAVLARRPMHTHTCPCGHPRRN